MSTAVLTSQSEAVRSPSDRGRALLRWIPPLAYLLLSVWLFRSLVRHPGTRVASASGNLGGDHTLYAWYFEWVRYCVTHGHNPLFTPSMNAPYGINVMWNTATFPLALLLLPVTVIFGAYPAVSLALVLSPAVDAAAAYWVARRILGRRFPGVEGRVVGPSIVGVVYGFGPFHVGHSGHLNLLFDPFLPLLVLVVDERLRRPQERAFPVGLRLGLLASAQFYVSEELAVVTALGAALAAGIAGLQCRASARRLVRPVGTSVAVACSIVVLVCGGPVLYQLAGPGHISRGVQVQDFRPDLAEFVQANWWQQWSSASGPAVGERTLFLGWPVLVGSILAASWLIWRRRDRFLLWWLPTTTLFALLSVGADLRIGGVRLTPGPWLLITTLPLLGGAIPLRVSLLTDAMVAMLAGYLVGLAGRRRLVPVTAAVLACLVPMTPLLRYPTLPAPAQSTFFRTDAARLLPAGTTVLVVPLPHLPELHALTWQIEDHLRFRLVGGYGVLNTASGYSSYYPSYPPGALVIAAATGASLSPAQRAGAETGLRTAGVQDVIVADGPHAAAQVATAVLITGCSVQHVDDVTLCRLPSG